MLKKIYFDLIVLFFKICKFFFNVKLMIADYFLKDYNNHHNIPKKNFKFNIKNFNEELYLLSQPDVLISVKSGYFKSGFHHFIVKGKKENRLFYNHIVQNFPKIKLLLAHMLNKKNFKKLQYLKMLILHQKKNNSYVKRENLNYSNIQIKKKNYKSFLSKLFLINLINYIYETKKHFKYEICLLINREIFFYLFKKSKKFNQSFTIRNTKINLGNFIQYKNFYLYLDDVKFNKEKIPEYDIGFFKKIFGFENFCIVKKTYEKKKKVEKYLNKAVLFTNILSKEYAHWMFEIYPSIVLEDKLMKNKNIPFLINSSLKNIKNIKNSLKLISNNRKVIYVDNETNINVKKLIIPEKISNVIYDNLNTKKAKLRHLGKFNYNKFKKFSSIVVKKFGSYNQSKRKVLVLRNSLRRNYVGMEKYLSIFKKKNFLMIYPERLSFKDQIKIFMNATEIVLPGGAAVANVIFCQKSCKITILVPKSNTIMDYFWSNFLKKLKFKNYKIIRCKIHKKYENYKWPYHSGYIIDKNTIKKINISQ